jgi:hypothetical protein
MHAISQQPDSAPVPSASLEAWQRQVHQEVDFERIGPVGRCAKRLLVYPLANYAPASLMKALLRMGKSELAQASWDDPGGWRSMVISYEGNPRQIADKLLVGGGKMSMALRNRKRLASWLIARLIDSTDNQDAHLLALGAGPGMIVSEAMCRANRPSEATLVDLSNDAFEFGRQHAERLGLLDRMHFVQSDVRHVQQFLDRPPTIMTMLGICEYLTDEQILSIASAAAEVMPAGSPVVCNSLSKAHHTDRFFRRVFGLHMNHRSPQQLAGLLEQSGFNDFVPFAEPLGVYTVMVGRRASQPNEGPADHA